VKLIEHRLVFELLNAIICPNCHTFGTSIQRDLSIQKSDSNQFLSPQLLAFVQPTIHFCQSKFPYRKATQNNDRKRSYSRRDRGTDSPIHFPANQSPLVLPSETIALVDRRASQITEVTGVALTSEESVQHAQFR